MGMSASQARLLALTSRQHDIGRQLQHLSLEKMSLTREMQKISKEYNVALQGKVLKWSNNAGVSYVDLTYGTLMRPNSANENKPILLTNNAGKVVIDQKYKEYAELISPDGKSGGDWSTNRTSILSKLTGISEAEIDNSVSTENAVYNDYEEVNKAQEALSKAEGEAFSDVANANFARNWGTVGGFDFSRSSGYLDVGSQNSASGNLKKYLDEIAENMKNYLEENDYKNFVKACDTFYEANKTTITNYGNSTANSKESVDKGTIAIVKDGNNFKFEIKDFIEVLLSLYQGTNGTFSLDKEGIAKFRIIKDGKNSDNYQNYLNAKKTYEDTVAKYQKTVDVDNQVFTSEQERVINFYDQLFTAIAENGWIADIEVSDPEYLNQMLQNNEYYITTMSPNENEEKLDSNGNKKGYITEYQYNTDLWSNTDNIFAVNDEYIRQEALTNYESEKSIINAKESRIDERMRNLETEQSSINQMIKGIETVRNDNEEKYFSIFT